MRIKGLEVFLYIIFKILFDLIFVKIYVPVNRLPAQTDITRHLTGWLLFLMIILLITGMKGEGLLKFVCQLFLIFNINASISVYQYQTIPFTNFLFVMLFWIVFVTLARHEQKKFAAKMIDGSVAGRGNLNIRYNVDRYMFLMFLACALFVAVMSYKYGDFRLFVSFADAVDYRYAFREVTLPGVVKYLFPWTAQIFLPFLMIFYLIRKNYVMVSGVGICALMMYSINGLKTWFIIYFVIISVFTVFRDPGKEKKYINYLVTGVIIFAVLALFTFRLGDGSTYPPYNMFYRVFHETVKLGYDYIEFFGDHDKLYLRESILRNIFDSPYQIPTAYLIGGISSNGQYLTQAVNGTWGDAYANFGFAGMAIYSFIIVKTYAILSKFLVHLDKRIGYSILTIILWSELNTSYFTWLLTGGVLLYAILLWLNKKDLAYGT